MIVATCTCNRHTENDTRGGIDLLIDEIRLELARMGEEAQGGQFGGAMMIRMFEASDKNKDGKLSGDEIPERMKERVSKMDQDGDGAISREEMKRATEMMEQRGDRPGRGNEDAGGAVKPKRPGSN